MSALVKRNFILLLSLLLTLLCRYDVGAEEIFNVDDDEHDGGEGEEEVEPAYAVLFPSFTLTIGVIIFYLLSRYAKALPYTGVMFLVVSRHCDNLLKAKGKRKIVSHICCCYIRSRGH